MASHEILMSVGGMGDPDEGDTDAWAQQLFPDGKIFSSNGRRWLALPGGREVQLIDVYYEDINDKVIAKYEGLKQAISGWAGPVETTLREYVGDVCVTVLGDEIIEAAQTRFVTAYAKALQLAHALVGPSGNIATVKLGVLAHSLGTYVGFEGLCRAYDAPFPQFLPVNFVMCAPMLSPICATEKFLTLNRYLTTLRSSRPHHANPFSDVQESIVGRTLALFNKTDPFYKVHSDAFYANSPASDLVDQFLTFETHPPHFWEAHFMGDSYLVNNRTTIAEFLFQ